MKDTSTGSSLHIELTNRCFLECPACPRTQWRELTRRPLVKTDLDIDLLAKFLDCAGGQDIDTLVLCGDYGDCIYSPNLLPFMDRFRHKKFTIVTNGSRRNLDFWHEFNSKLTSQDIVIFSIDGLESSNHLYRRNSHWSSIMEGLDIVCQGPAQVIWKTIIFSFNQQHLDEMKVMAESKGAIFSAEKTHRFGDDSLKPDEHLIEINHQFNDSYIKDWSIAVDPGCTNEKVVTCDGFLFPCDWIRNPRTLYKSQLWKQKQHWIDRLNIRDINFDQAMDIVREWAGYVRQNSLDNSPLVDVLCKMKCREGCRQNKFVDV